ncbi:MAG: co-chaperone GroES [Candidatus Omnitrophica bacterium]|nr:co-chaperone GroES [Candidatus Omnitrophota bacterium]
MKLQPLSDKVIVRPLEPEEKTRGGIVLPDTAKEKPQEGKIVAVGKGKVLDNGQVKAPNVKAGDRVLYGKYGGTEVKSVEGEELLILREDDIFAVIKE